MSDILIIDEEDLDFVWETVQQQQMIFHPQIAPDGKFDFQKFSASKSKKPFILFIDRNIFSSLLELCEKGTLKTRAEVQRIGLIMAWAEMNDIAISAGFAVEERATQINSQDNGLVELQKFSEIFDYYPMQLWLDVAEGRVSEIAPIQYTRNPAKNITANYATGNDHYYMAVASLIHMVSLYRDDRLSPAERIKDFFKWMIDNLLVSEYILTYAALLFTSQEGIKAPKNARSNNIDRVIEGCKNQAWDIAYLTNWSVWYSNTDEYAEEMLFATNDILLKRIFISQNNPYRFNGVLYSVFSKKDYTDIAIFVEGLMENRIKPDFGEDPMPYFEKLIDAEKANLIGSFPQE